MPMKHAALWALGIAAVAVLGGFGTYYFLYEGSVAVSVKDAPTGSLAHVNVTFSSVAIHRSGKDNATWDTVSVGTRTVDLLTLTNVSMLLGNARLAPGHYEQIRLDVTSATATDLSGHPWTVNVTDGQLKVVQQFDVMSGKTTNIVVDIHIDWTGTGYILTPMIGSVTMS
jgi:Domain of unknown function (DUF4382)